jgi:hypothetical protein
MDIEPPHQSESNILSGGFKTVEPKDFLGDPFHPNEIKSPLKEGEYAMVSLRLNSDGKRDEDMGFLRMLVEGVKNIQDRVFYPKSREPSKEARLIVSADVSTIKVFPPGTSLKDVMSDNDMLAKIGQNTPYWVEILGDDRKPDRRYLVFRRNWGEQDLLVAIEEGSGMIGNVYALTEGNKFGGEVIIIKDENGEKRSEVYDQFVRYPQSSLNVRLYRIS